MYAVITGASSGIGEQFAKRLAKEGYDLILVARRRERLTALSNKLKATHKELECDIFTADLMQLDECQRLSDYLEEKDIEIFINNAGYGDCGLFEETDIAKEMGMIDVNVRAVHFLTKKLLRQMRVKDRGFILNVASSAGLIPAGPYMAAYYASKHMLRAFQGLLHVSFDRATAMCMWGVCVRDRLIQSSMMWRMCDLR